MHSRGIMKIIAHRGFSGAYPENTMLAFRKAVEAGADGLEFDVVATKDSKLIVFHDHELKRLTGVKGKVASKYWSEIEKLRIGTEKIPLLRELLEYLKTTTLPIINIELKIDGFEEELLEVVWGSGLEDRIIISSISSKIIEKIRTLDPDLRLAYLLDNRPDRLRTLGRLHEKVKLYSVHPFHKRPLSTRRLVERAKKMGLKVYAWFLRGTNNIGRVKELARLGIDGVITDYPSDAIKAVKKN
jgi:glycerophosphoryl diester phosphodiesterase